MEANLFNRLQAMLLALATVGLVILAVLNFRQESKFLQPDDGVWWAETTGGLEANKVIPDSPAQLAGIRKGDLLTAVNEVPVARVAISSANSTIRAHTAKLNTRSLVTEWLWILRSSSILRQPIAVRTRACGLSASFISRSAFMFSSAAGLRHAPPTSIFSVSFRLPSTPLNTLAPTHRENGISPIVFWSNIIAGALQPALFLHFAISFPEERFKDGGRRWLLAILYAPGIALLGLWIIAMTRWQATGILLHRLDQINYGYIAAFYVLAATLFSHQLCTCQYAPAAPAVEMALLAARGWRLARLLFSSPCRSCSTSARPVSSPSWPVYLSSSFHSPSAGPSSATD